MKLPESLHLGDGFGTSWQGAYKDGGRGRVQQAMVLLVTGPAKQKAP